MIIYPFLQFHLWKAFLIEESCELKLKNLNGTKSYAENKNLFIFRTKSQLIKSKNSYERFLISKGMYAFCMSEMIFSLITMAWSHQLVFALSLESLKSKHRGEYLTPLIHKWNPPLSKLTKLKEKCKHVTLLMACLFMLFVISTFTLLSRAQMTC